MQRFGTKDQPVYRIIATDTRKKRNSRSLSVLGFYNPNSQPETFKLDKNRLNKWLANGAQMSDSVRNLVDSNSTL